MKRSPRVLTGSFVLLLLVLILILLGGDAWLALKLRPGSNNAAESPSAPGSTAAASIPLIPARFTVDLPASCQQVMLVISPNETSVPAEMHFLERDTPDLDAPASWTRVRPPIPVTLGRNGLAWGVGEHHSPRPEGFREKREGDGCSPAGIFRIPFAFGMASVPEAQTEMPQLRLAYTPLTDSVIGVDDPDSLYYNQVVDSNLIPRDWSSHEPMNRYKVLYRWGAFIAHNPKGVPNLGSCIFIHIWPGPGESTAGCTGMADEDVQWLLGRLDPAKEPRLVQTLAEWGRKE